MTPPSFCSPLEGLTPAEKMDQRIHQNRSWAPTCTKAKTLHRRDLWDLLKMCRKRSPNPSHSSNKESLLECVLLLHRNIPRTCCCLEPPARDSCWTDAFLLPMLHLLGGRPLCDLLSELFLQLESLHRCQRLVPDVPLLQRLLSVFHGSLTPEPPRMSCRGRRAAAPEDQSCECHRYRYHNNRTPDRRPRRRGRGEEPPESLYNQSEELPGCDAESDHSPNGTGRLASIQELKNSLETDLEQHRLYLTHIECRLSGLERRAQDVSRFLERAGLELEAIKRASTRGPQRSPESAGLGTLSDWDLQVLDRDRWDWRPDDPCLNPPGGTEETARCCDTRHPADGSSGSWSDLQTGISLCQDQVNVLIQQITQQIHQTETELNDSIKPEETRRK